MKILGMFTDENDKGSMTRFVLFVTSIVFAIIAITDAFSSIEIEPSVYQIVQLVFAFGLGGQTIRTSIKNSKGKLELNKE